MRWFGDVEPTDDDFWVLFISSAVVKGKFVRVFLLKTIRKSRKPFELTVVEESPQLGLLEDIELLLGDELLSVRSW